MKTLSKKGPHPLEPFKQVVDVNVAGTFNVIRLAVNHMKDTEPLTKSGERGKYNQHNSMLPFSTKHKVSSLQFRSRFV